MLYLCTHTPNPQFTAAISAGGLGGTPYQGESL